MPLTSNEVIATIINYPGYPIVYKDGEEIVDLTIEKEENKFVIKKDNKNE